MARMCLALAVCGLALLPAQVKSGGHGSQTQNLGGGGGGGGGGSKDPWTNAGRPGGGAAGKPDPWTNAGRQPEGRDPQWQNGGQLRPGGKDPQWNGGQRPGGNDPQWNGGQRPGGQRPGGNDPQWNGGQRPGGQRPGGQRPGGQRPGGQRPGGNDPQWNGGQRPGGQRPGGNDPQWNGGRPSGQQQVNPSCRMPNAQGCGIVNSAQQFCTAAANQNSQLAGYMQSLFSCVSGGLRQSGSSCSSASTAMGQYLFQDRPDRNCMHQSGQLCQVRQFIQGLPFNDQSVFPDSGFAQQASSAFNRVMQYC